MTKTLHLPDNQHNIDEDIFKSKMEEYLKSTIEAKTAEELTNQSRSLIRLIRIGQSYYKNLIRSCIEAELLNFLAIVFAMLERSHLDEFYDLAFLLDQEKPNCLESIINEKHYQKYIHRVFSVPHSNPAKLNKLFQIINSANPQFANEVRDTLFKYAKQQLPGSLHHNLYLAINLSQIDLTLCKELLNDQKVKDKIKQGAQAYSMQCNYRDFLWLRELIKSIDQNLAREIDENAQKRIEKDLKSFCETISEPFGSSNSFITLCQSFIFLSHTKPAFIADLLKDQDIYSYVAKALTALAYRKDENFVNLLIIIKNVNLESACKLLQDQRMQPLISNAVDAYSKNPELLIRLVYLCDATQNTELKSALSKLKNIQNAANALFYQNQANFTLRPIKEFAKLLELTFSASPELAHNLVNDKKFSSYIQTHLNNAILDKSIEDFINLSRTIYKIDPSRIKILFNQKVGTGYTFLHFAMQHYWSAVAECDILKIDPSQDQDFAIDTQQKELLLKSLTSKTQDAVGHEIIDRDMIWNDIKNDYEALIKLLISFGADTEILNDKGQTPKQYAKSTVESLRETSVEYAEEFDKLIREIEEHQVNAPLSFKPQLHSLFNEDKNPEQTSTIIANPNRGILEHTPTLDQLIIENHYPKPTPHNPTEPTAISKKTTKSSFWSK